MGLPSINPREIMDQATNVAATGAITAPLVWWQWFESVSVFFTVATPILGGLWFITQIWIKIAKDRRERNEHRND